MAKAKARTRSARKRARARKREKRTARAARRSGTHPGVWVAAVLGGFLVVGLIVLGVRSNRAGRPYYPPTDVVGHTENVPPSHILDVPMPLSMQKHMLEHADGQGPPGVIINYNCEDFECEPDLIDKLKAIAQDYPEFVYLAPFPNMSAKIAITRRGAIEVLDEFDEERIRRFIENR